jgi:hypothetical protein
MVIIKNRIHFLWICLVMISCDRSPEKNPDVQPTDQILETKRGSDTEESIKLREEILDQMKVVGYFDETNLIKKKLTLIGIIGQVAPLLDYSMDIDQFTFLVDELKLIAPESLEKATENKDGKVNLLELLNHIYEQ